MKRVFVKGHPFNGTAVKPWYDGARVIFVRDVIECDGQLGAFAAWGFSKAEAQREFNKFPRADCIRRYSVNPDDCPVHDHPRP